MNKRFIIINFAAFAVMLFLSTGCKQDGKQDAVPSYRVITVFRHYPRATRCGYHAANIRPHHASMREGGHTGDDRASTGSDRPNTLSGSLTHSFG